MEDDVLAFQREPWCLPTQVVRFLFLEFEKTVSQMTVNLDTEKFVVRNSNPLTNQNDREFKMLLPRTEYQVHTYFSLLTRLGHVAEENCELANKVLPVTHKRIEGQK